MISDTPKTADSSRKSRRRRISSVHSSSIYEEATLSYPDPEIPKVEVATLVAAFENKSTLDLTDVINEEFKENKRVADQINFNSDGNIVSNIYSPDSTTSNLKQQAFDVDTVLSVKNPGVTPETAAASLLASANSSIQYLSVEDQAGNRRSSDGKIQLENTFLPSVLADVETAGYNSNSDIEMQQRTTSNRSQRKFSKRFKQLPQEEVVIQRYSCALVSDILLQGHLYITENYFAFHSNVFGYVTRLQIPVRSVTKITKEKTAIIIPNAIGICTEEDVKHIFSSLLWRDTTFKLMTRIWKRTIRESGTITEEDYPKDYCDAPRAGGLDEIIDDVEISDSDVDSGRKVSRKIGRSQSQNMLEVNPIKQTPSGTFFYQPSLHAANSSANSSQSCLANSGSIDSINSQNYIKNTRQGHVFSICVVILLIFLLCSSMHLVFRVDSLQRQVESQHFYKTSGDWPGLGQSEESLFLFMNPLICELGYYTNLFECN